jgi:HlyD family secretion protein
MAVVVLAVAAGLTGAYFYAQSGGSQSRFRTQPVTRGELTAAVSATGSLNAVTTVLVGSQVSGQISALFADFNSQVKRNQLIARIDPATFEARVAQARAEVEGAESAVLNQRAQVERARAEVENARAGLASAKAQTAKAEVQLLDARRNLARQADLFRKELVARSDLDSAQAAHDAAEAQLEAGRAQEQALASTIRSAEAQLRVAQAQLGAAEATVKQKRAALEHALLDLDHTNIRAPVDGVVVSRQVDIGQTVAASLQAPTLFTIAQDLTKMQIDTNVDEADIGRIEEGQEASFTVDAFPGQAFPGRIVQIRKAPRPVQNVVTYNVVVAVDNPRQRLLPGMTANVRIVTDRRQDVLRVPNAALRFRPPGEEPPPPADAQQGPGAAAGGLPGLEQVRERLVRALRLTDEQQKQIEPVLQAMFDEFRGLQRVPPAQRRAAASNIREQYRQKIRALLTPDQQAIYDQLPSGQAARAASRAGRVWIAGPAGKPEPVTVQLGISDGSHTELLRGELKEGQEVIIATVGPSQAPRGTAPPASSSPLGPRPRF